MKVLQSFGNDELAKVYVGITKEGSWVEFVESLQPPLPRKDKWVLIVSTMDGCPVKCGFCDAGGSFRRNLTREEIMDQIHYMVARRFTGAVNVAKFKIQFARIGEPSLNPSVLEVLEELDGKYDAPGLLPSVSSVAPLNSESFFEELLEIKNERYVGRFQLQFSVHSTDRDQRDYLIPVRKWDLEKIADYGSQFCGEHDRKVTLNFALSSGSLVESAVISRLFDPAKFLVKITPVNPTYSSRDRKLDSAVDDDGSLVYHQRFVDELRSDGFDVLVSVGEPEENRIGSNCGLYVKRHLSGSSDLSGAYALVKKDTT
ncbi:MAG TPA: radical SAM protein [Kosmotogaceae bacterium]|nr:radical SAM protein [Kosmotogaceae bacterium]